MQDFQIIDPHERHDAPATFTPRPTLPLPSPGVDFDIRPGTHADIPWIDELRAAAKNSLGFASFGELEGHLKKGNVYLAINSSAPGSEQRIGYCIAANRYYQRDEVGQIYQMNIAPEFRRQHVAANLLKKVWETWPAGVKLCGCWCAQDLEANAYWEKCGFTAVAFRAGSRKGKNGQQRMHIYWQKRIRQGDTGDPTSGGTPHWYPSQTSGGAMNESRIVLPIPPGTSWRDAKPALLPGVGELFEAIAAERAAMEKRALLQLAPPASGSEKPRVTKADREAAKAERERKRARNAENMKTVAGSGGLRIGWNAKLIEPVPTEEEVAAQAKAKKLKLRQAKNEARAAAKKAAKQMQSKNDPALVAAARDLRDRWQAAVEREPILLSQNESASYDVSRVLEDVRPVVKKVENVKRLAT